MALMMHKEVVLKVVMPLRPGEETNGMDYEGILMQYTTTYTYNIIESYNLSWDFFWCDQNCINTCASTY